MNMKLDLKRIAGLVMGAALVIFLVYAFLPQPVPVDMSEVTRGPMLVTVSDDGMTRVRDLYEVSAPVSGNVIRIELEPGDPVIAGETVLAYLQPVDPTLLDRRTAREAEAAVQAAEAALSLARSEVESAEAELEFANAEFNRYQTLAETNTASAAALDRARLNQARGSANLSIARSAVAVRAAELETARAYLITATSGDGDLESEGLVPIRSPIDGEVLAVQHESAGVVRAGEVLIEVGNPQDIEIVVDLLSTDAVKVSEGADVLIGGWGGGTLFGVVKTVEPKGFTKISALGIEEQRVNIIIDFVGETSSWRTLGHEFRVEPQIIVWEAEDILRLPVSALFSDNRRWSAFRVTEGRAALTSLEIGEVNDQYVQVLSGLAERDTVVLYPSNQIEDGLVVKKRGS